MNNLRRIYINMIERVDITVKHFNKLGYFFVIVLICWGTLLPPNTQASTLLIAENDQHAMISSIPELFATELLSMAEARIFPNHGTNNQLVIEGITEAYSNVDEISVQLYIQYWNGTSWVDLDYAGETKETNANYVRGRQVYQVESGYSYRTKGIHKVTKGNKTESTTTYTGAWSM